MILLAILRAMENSDTVPQSSIMVVDDDESVSFSICAVLQDQGYHIEIARSAEQALELLTKRTFDAVVTDIMLPGLSGVALLETMRGIAPDLAVIMLTGEPTLGSATASLRAGACDFLTKPVSRAQLLQSVAAAVKKKHVQDMKHRLIEKDRQYKKLLESMVDERTQELHQAFEGTIRAMSVVVELRDPYTAGHQKRVACLARRIAQDMGLDRGQVLGTYYAGFLHDLGKIGVPSDILNSPGLLCSTAKNLIDQHVENGYGILKEIVFPWPVAEIVRQHHEKLDGSGYPRGLSGEAISIEARIICVADVVEAMATRRPYRRALGVEMALDEIEKWSGILYDPAVVGVCTNLFREKGYTLESMPAA